MRDIEIPFQKIEAKDKCQACEKRRQQEHMAIQGFGAFTPQGFFIEPREHLTYLDRNYGRL